MKDLIIAEKPSVARDIAGALGKVPKKSGQDYYEGDDKIIASAVGHVVELFMPEDIDAKLKSWRLDTLPILPETFELKPIEKNKQKFNDLKKLLRRKDVERVINACDAGREGELIFNYVYELAGSDKPVKRLWMVSMTPEGIREAFQHLRDNAQMSSLSDAAHCRSESDWLVGINGTRALTKRMFGMNNVATVGRVQTPTLAMVIDRENEIRAFEPRDYWRIKGVFRIADGAYEGYCQKPGFKKGDDPHDRADRIWDEATAREIRDAAAGADEAEVTEEKKRTRQSCPRLYDLTSLQREANGRYGFPAGKTLRVAQALYEQHKVITYPRTNSRALPEDYPGFVRDVLGAFSGQLAPLARKALDNDWVNPSDKRVFNNAQVSDHFAIVPTGNFKSLGDDERKIFDMICRRFIGIFFPQAEYDVTTRISRVGEHAFKTEGKVLAVAGWLEVAGKAQQESDTLPQLGREDGDPARAAIEEIEMEHDATRPPPRYTEATLLGAMETAGKRVEDEELAEAMKESGLGTPATRASIIDHLVKEKYLLREGRELWPTPKAEELVRFVKTIGVETLTSPAMTGEWEKRLNQIEQGKLSREEFMDGIRNLTTDLVERTRRFEENEDELPETEFISPTDGKPMRETFRGYRSQDGRLAVRKNMGNRELASDEIHTLLKEGKVGPLDGFISKAGKPFSAQIVLEDNKAKFDFGNTAEDDENQDLSQFPVICNCPVDGAPVRETPNAYVCENYKRAKDEGCSFRVGRTILGKPIPPEAFTKLVSDKKTDLLKGFRSNRTKRLFDAHLVLQEGGKVGFEFPARPAKKGAKKKAAKKTAKKKAAKKAAQKTARSS